MENISIRKIYINNLIRQRDKNINLNSVIKVRKQCKM